ncbi:MAG TPA: DNA polymerase III subunit delta [Actinomycetota bacterium]
MTAPAYLLSGEEFLAAEALDKVRAEVATDPLSEVAFEADASATELLEALSTPSLLGGRRLVVVRGAQDLKKEHAEALAEYLESPSPETVLVLVASGRTKLDAAIKKHGAVVPLEAPRGRRLAGWVVQRARAYGLRMDDRGGWALIDACGTELRDLDGAISQLATGSGSGARVGPAEVRRMFPRLADQRVFAFTDAVGDRRLAPAMGSLRRLLEQGDEPLVLFGSLVAHVRRMLRARRYADEGTAAVADALGLPGWRAERLQKQARGYREEELVAALGILAAADVEIKGGDLPPEVALEKAVLQIVSGEKVPTS